MRQQNAVRLITPGDTPTELSLTGTITLAEVREPKCLLKPSQGAANMGVS